MSIKNLSGWSVGMYGTYEANVHNEDGGLLVTTFRQVRMGDGDITPRMLADGLVDLIDTALAILKRDSITAHRTDLRAALVAVIGEERVGEVLGEDQPYDPAAHYKALRKVAKGAQAQRERGEATP